ncbi:MAG: IclR family transcriptional regulator [Terriglobia bacterium]
MTGLQGKAGLAEPYYSRTIGRALDVLECFPDAPLSLSLKEISGVVRLPEASLFRILLTLESRGYLERNADGSYRLSRKVMFGRQLERAEKFVKLVRPELHGLASRFNETASLAYLFEDRIQVLDTVESFHDIRMTNKLGRVLPPHCSALGKALAAFQDQPLTDRILEVYGLARHTDHTIVDRDALLEEFKLVRARGYAVDREESAAGGICVGVPICLGAGRAVAALSVSTPKVRMTAEKEQEIAQTLKESARRIGESAGAMIRAPAPVDPGSSDAQQDPRLLRPGF